MNTPVNDIITSTFLAISGQILFVILPVVVAVSVGLVVVGLIKQQFMAVLAGIAFPVLVAVVGSSMASNSEAGAIMSLMPYTIGFAVVIFLVSVLPAIVRAVRQR